MDAWKAIPYTITERKINDKCYKMHIQIINGFTFNFLRKIVLGDKNIPIFDKYKDIPI